MSQELMHVESTTVILDHQRSVAPGGNVGAIHIETERAIAEARGQMQLAKMFPRDLNEARAELMVACKMRDFAEQAFYTVPNRGSGPSIRFAEEVARVYGNFEFGHRELYRDHEKSEVEVYAWDKQKNNRSIRQITVLHVLDAGGTTKKLKTQADIDNKIANVASKQARGRILALLPKWLVAEAIAECKKTLLGENKEPIEVRVRKMLDAFMGYGVTKDHIEKYLKKKTTEILADELVDLQGIFVAIREGAKPSEYFNDEEPADDTLSSVAAAAGGGSAPEAKATAPRASRAKPEQKPEQKPQAQAEQKQEVKPQPEQAKTEPEPAAEQVKTEPQAQQEQAQQVDQQQQDDAGGQDNTGTEGADLF